MFGTKPIALTIFISISDDSAWKTSSGSARLRICCSSPTPTEGTNSFQKTGRLQTEPGRSAASMLVSVIPGFPVSCVPVCGCGPLYQTAGNYLKKEAALATIGPKLVPRSRMADNAAFTPN